MKRIFCVLAGVALLVGLWTGCEKEEDKAKASISGVVTDKETGTPLSGVTIELQPGGQQAQTTEDGTYIINRLKAGIYTVKAQKEGYVDYIREEIQLIAEQTMQLDIEMEEEAFLEFQITNEEGKPIEEIESYGTICNFTIVNSGNIAGEWRIKTDADWLTFGMESGSLAAGTSERIKVRMDINKMQPDDEAEVILSSEQEQGDMRLKIIYKERPSYTETAFDLGMEMVYVSGGEFEMGATAEQGDAADSDERPVRTVSLDSYHIGRYEVTQGQWKAVMGTNPSYFDKGDDYPVESVSWNDAQEFCKRLSEKTGKEYVLPTEAMWEYAARGGVHKTQTMYAGSDDIKEVAWYDGNSDENLESSDPDFGTHKVGTKKANALGIYDMSGNVWEWCSDWYGDYDESDTENPQGPAEGSYRVLRGGGWDNSAGLCRVSIRSRAYPVNRFNRLGFRVAVLL